MFCSFGSPNPCNQGQVTDFFAKNAKHTIVVSFFCKQMQIRCIFFAVLVHQTQVIKAIFFSKNAIELTIFTKFLKKMQIFCFQIWFTKPVQSKPGHWLFLQKMQTIAKNCKTNAIGGPLNRLFFRIFWVVFLIFSYFLFFLIWTKIRKIRKHEK